MKGFIDEFAATLSTYLEPYLDEEVYIDRDRLQPGYQFNEALARALCESACMIVVYVPRYEKHTYCLREYAAMEALEKQRRQLLGQTPNPDWGFIIPVILRGGDNVPERIKNSTHYCDFSKFTTASPKISANEAHVNDIENIAKVIHQIYSYFETQDLNPSGQCDSFRLPGESQIESWRDSARAPSSPFPLRELGR